MFRALWDLEKWMEWSGDHRMEWNGRDLDSPDLYGFLRECYLSHHLKTNGFMLNKRFDQ